MHENREISSAPSVMDEGRSVKAHSRTTDTHALEKSDCAVLPVNRPNKGRQLPAEAGEGRVQLEENIVQAHMLLTLSRDMHVPALDGVREANRCLWVALTLFILQKSRMRKRARTDLCGGRSAMIVPTANTWRCQCGYRMLADLSAPIPCWT